MATDLTQPSMPVRHILVIGGAGYIGSVLVCRLLERQYRVRVLDALLYDNARSLEGVADDPNFEFLQGDSLKSEDLYAALRGVTDVVLLAALVGDPVCKKYPEHAEQINHQGAIGVLTASNHYPINKLIFTSTCSNYGIFQGDEPADESAPLRPVSLYAETKVAVEKFVMGLKGRVDYCPTILRLATAFGLGYRTRFDLTVNHFTRDLALGRELVVYDQTTWRPYCHVEDISEAIIRVLESPDEPVKFQVYNVGGNQNNHSKEQIVELIRRRLPDARVTYRSGGSDPRNYQVEFGKIHRALGFVPKYAVADGIDELVAAVQTGQFADVEDRQLYFGNDSIPEFDAVVRAGQPLRQRL